jgi:uncharacterized membrane protein
VQAIALLHAEHRQQATFAEHIVDRATTFVGRPRFLLGLIGVAGVWMAANVAIRHLGGTPPDPPPFAWMDLACTALALFIAVLILTSQRRADKFANLREQMTLEATLLTEQKTGKIIELLEELRRDSPQVRDRPDAEAEQMARKADPHAVLSAIDATVQDAVEAVKSESGGSDG